MGFETEADARQMVCALEERLGHFGLALHKTRLIEFGRLRALARRQRGERRPMVFVFLGFTHYCGWTREGRFIVKHKTQSKRLTRKLKALRQEAWRLMYAPMATQHRWYASVLTGHYGYYGRPHNYPALNGFRQQVRRFWFCCLRRRSQKSRRMGWADFEALTCATLCPRLGSHAHGRAIRHDAGYLREEPAPEKPHARTCEGEAEWPSYSTTTRNSYTAYIKP
jgi:RNA-directed DNA polymerase